MAKQLLDNASIFEDVIQTQVTGEGPAFVAVSRGLWLKIKAHWPALWFTDCGELCIFHKILFSPYLIFCQKRKCVTAEGNVSVLHCENIPFSLAFTPRYTCRRKAHAQKIPVRTINPWALLSFFCCSLLSGVSSRMDDVTTHRWFIGTMCAVALLTLVALMACFVRKNKGGKYAGTPPPRQQDMLSMAKGQLALSSFPFYFA